MRGKSHLCLGRYLSEHYMAHLPKRYVSAFLFGCIEPDRNPATYLKGSFRHQWLRGHNYRNARRFLRRISLRLETRENWKLFDYYTLGKLIHYTADAFTYAHNDTFPTDLRDHREYEIALQEHFLQFMEQDPTVNVRTARSIMDILSAFHRSYETLRSDVRTDSIFALAACCCVLTVLFPKPIL